MHHLFCAAYQEAELYLAAWSWLQEDEEEEEDQEEAKKVDDDLAWSWLQLVAAWGWPQERQ